VAPRPPQGPIQRAFDGLLGFLDLKGTGVAPNHLEGVIRGTLDVQQFLTARPHRRMLHTVNYNASIEASFQSLSSETPPQGKVWMFRTLQAFVTVPELTKLWQIGVARSTSMTPASISDIELLTDIQPNLVAPNVGDGEQLVYAVCKTPFILLPGEFVGFSISLTHPGGPVPDAVAFSTAAFLEFSL
jgi:hypothetical protein